MKQEGERERDEKIWTATERKKRKKKKTIERALERNKLNTKNEEKKKTCIFDVEWNVVGYRLR